MRRSLACFAAMVLAAGALARPVTITVGGTHTPSVRYGPADMLCDLNTCRLFNLPEEAGLPPGAIVEFGLPQLSGQDRVDIRRCFQVCRASVVGFAVSSLPPPERGNPTVAITPVEMQLE